MRLPVAVRLTDANASTKTNASREVMRQPYANVSTLLRCVCQMHSIASTLFKCVPAANCAYEYQMRLVECECVCGSFDDSDNTYRATQLAM